MYQVSCFYHKMHNRSDFLHESALLIINFRFLIAAYSLSLHEQGGRDFYKALKVWVCQWVWSQNFCFAGFDQGVSMEMAVILVHSIFSVHQNAMMAAASLLILQNNLVSLKMICLIN